MYACGLNPNGPTKFVPGRLNHPISVGGVSVQPGDLVVGDGDGVTVIERDKAEPMLSLAAEKVAAGDRRIAEIRGGKGPACARGSKAAMRAGRRDRATSVDCERERQARASRHGADLAPPGARAAAATSTSSTPARQPSESDIARPLRALTTRWRSSSATARSARRRSPRRRR
jgi:hypothetical protein